MGLVIREKIIYVYGNGLNIYFLVNFNRNCLNLNCRNFLFNYYWGRAVVGGGGVMWLLSGVGVRGRGVVGKGGGVE